MTPYNELSNQTKNLDSFAGTQDFQQYNKLQLHNTEQPKSLELIDETNSEEKEKKNERLNDQQLNHARTIAQFKDWYGVPENQLKTAAKSL